MGLLAQGALWLRGQRCREAVNVIYRRGAAIAGFPAVPAATRAATQSAEVIIDAAYSDWFVERDDLLLAGEPIVPQVGDRIEVVYPHGVEQFLVATYGNEPCWRWHGSDGGTYRIHTVRV
jgi:hypothetical protein